ncbi:MAG: hypothetical protein QOI06_1696 [Nocardioidaceae bacterium]|jgi:hypothetical protein|nr:hypothetical protein [Nocardioidaceae bacterium]
MARKLTNTSRAHLRDGSAVNTHFCFDPSVYQVRNVPNPLILQRIIDLKVGYVRERWWPGCAGQQKAFAKLTSAGVGLFLFIGDVNYTAAEVARDVAALATSGFTNHVVAVCGPNEPNSGAGGPNWAAKVVAVQKAIWTEVNKHSTLAHKVAIVGCALKHNVAHLDVDYHAIAKAGIARWCDAGDFHFYPGSAGPVMNASEEKLARDAYGPMSMWHSETGWTGGDTSPVVAGGFSVEALLRNHLTGIVGTILYGFADEAQYVPGREGLFGIMTATKPKPAYTRIKSLLATPDGGQVFPGWLSQHAGGVESDTGVVVTSEGHGRWTVYLLRERQRAVTLCVPPTQRVDRGSMRLGHHSNRRYTIPLGSSMTVAYVTTA